MAESASTGAPTEGKVEYPKVEVGEDEQKKWGTYMMGAPSAPSAHPQNQEAAHWTPRANDDHLPQPSPSPYVHTTPIQQQPKTSPMESALKSFNKWAKKAEDVASNVWTNLKSGSSVPGAAWGKMNLGAKALTEGGFEGLFKQSFPVEEDEKLKKTFACYLSTSTGPVAGTIYLSSHKIGFCSDRPLAFTLPSGQQSWTYYRVMVPLYQVKAVNPSTNPNNPTEKYIQIVTVDGHEFWYMGFVNYDKALSHLSSSVTPITNVS